jgi:hypothetical protein
MLPMGSPLHLHEKQSIKITFRILLHGMKTRNLSPHDATC